MKTLIFMVVIISCAFFVQAQEKPGKLKSMPFNDKIPGQRNYQFDDSPQFKLPDPEAPALTDSLAKEPRFIIGDANTTNEVTDYFNMPAVKPGAEFSSNMPIMVPDSSVHYFIKQMKIDSEMHWPESKD